MADGRRDAKRRAAEGGGHLSDQFLEGVLARSEGAGEIAVEAGRMSYRVPTFMQRRSVPIDGLEERRWRRHLHVVLRRIVEGVISPDAEVYAGGLDQRLDTRLDSAWRRRRRSRRDRIREIVDLICIENREALQERNGARFATALCGAPLRIIRNEAVGINDGGAAFAFAHMTAERQRLAKRQPALAGVRLLDCFSPEDEDVNARVVAIGRCVLVRRRML